MLREPPMRLLYAWFQGQMRQLEYEFELFIQCLGTKWVLSQQIAIHGCHGHIRHNHIIQRHDCPGLQFLAAQYRDHLGRSVNIELNNRSIS